jgi:hypothetical protein
MITYLPYVTSVFVWYKINSQCGEPLVERRIADFY